MEENHSNGKVLIVGAGLGGLTLAQILFKNDVPFEIFERDLGTGSRKQGWAVALVECLPELEELLPTSTAENLCTVSVNYNSDEHDELAFVDAVTGEKIGSVGNIAYGEPGCMLRTSRERFRKYLWESNNLPISSGKRFTHYEEDKEGVTAFFLDGSSARGSILVGAEGLNSHILDQLIGSSHHKPVLSKHIPIFGEVELPPAQYEPLHSLATAAILAGAPRVRIQIGKMGRADVGSTEAYFWTVMLQREDPLELAEWVQKATKQEIYDLVLESTKHLHPVCKDPLRFGGPEAVVLPQPKYLEFEPPDEMPEGRVTVLGDAAHAMIPLRGAGANTAILDSCDLARLLVKAHEDERDFASVVHPYLEKMIPRGQKNVLSSRAAGEGDEDVARGWQKMFQRSQEPQSGVPSNS